MNSPLMQVHNIIHYNNVARQVKSEGVRSWVQPFKKNVKLIETNSHWLLTHILSKCWLYHGFECMYIYIYMYMYMWLFHTGDRPLVVQFAATNAEDFARAAELVAPFSDAVDLNCGCPQRWALSEGYGAALIKQPALIADMVQQARARSNLPISIKIRIHADLR